MRQIETAEVDTIQFGSERRDVIFAIRIVCVLCPSAAYMTDQCPAVVLAEIQSPAFTDEVRGAGALARGICPITLRPAQYMLCLR